MHYYLGQIWTEIEQKWTAADRNGQKQTERIKMDKSGQNRQKRTETDINRQEKTKKRIGNRNE